MCRKIKLEDFGKLVKPQVLTEAFLHYRIENIDPGEWWTQVNGLAYSSKTYKKDTIAGTYGKPLPMLFADLGLDSYVGTICSFLIFQGSDFQFVHNTKTAARVMAQKNRWSIRAVGIKLHKSYDMATKTPGPTWEPTDNPNIVWYYKPKHLLLIEDVERFNNIEVGDMIAFKKTQALVLRVQRLKRRRFWNCCSWSSKKITILSGGRALQVRMSARRPYEIVKGSRKTENPLPLLPVLPTQT